MLPRLAFLALLAKFASADWTWPNPVWDEIEDITHVQSGLFRAAIIDGVNPCGAFHQSNIDDPSRQASSEWLRTAFHDAITHNAQTGTGGVDASLIWETDRSENLGGRSFNATFGFMVNFYNIRASMSDLVALATYTAVRNCGGPGLVMRAGRIDATEPGPEGAVPEPKDNINKLLAKFANAGFNKTDMIQASRTSSVHEQAGLIAIGGVHGQFFPELTGDSNETNFVHFDNTTSTFDNKVATEYLDGTTQNPLVTAPGGNNSDFAVFNSDGNSTIKAMSEPPTFLSTCGSILQRMIDTVPSTVKLSGPIAPLKIKPMNLQLQLLSTGQLQLDGYIRVRNDDRGASQTPSVKLVYADRTGQINSTKIDTAPNTAQGGTGFGFEATFWFYPIASTILPNGISHFNVSVTNTTTGVETIYDNNGNGYPVQDNVVFQPAQSCLIFDTNSNQNLTLTAAVRDGLNLTNPTSNIVVKTPRANAVVPALVVKSVPMKLLQSTTFGYTLYTVSYALPPALRTSTVDVWVEGPNGVKYEDGFKKTGGLKSECGAF
ncbi:unnamed protein product [Rhizoctonia solani]|uniref:Peroxidase n=1 Tax=Rhizoctonia solani TaxID=456999 RepID=A0A8H3DMB2_9AGAM|nr:unnamed protein product [Rhizoctonia solani]